MEFRFRAGLYVDGRVFFGYSTAFYLRDLTCVERRKLKRKYYIRQVKDWERFKESAFLVRLYDYNGLFVKHFANVEVALRSAYILSYRYAIRELKGREIVPCMGPDNPPLEVIERVYPFELKLTPFPKNLDHFLESLVRKLSDDLDRNP